ncbi:hypothetical protein [Empedobacter falsenii]|uniref:hypothetical protein n=1 Tax=Empedobacter falsenii TaxID=343874 RepID=UPI001C8EA79C|nr:hypothetical protein [Empedobacter falsenii]MBY0067979.1 hypothetical protein [Empedobacter falsenii]
MNQIRLTKDNISLFPKYNKLLQNGKIKFDSLGRLRYLHGAPIGDLIQIKIDQSGKSIFQEISDEWFDPESEKAKNFIWL